MVNIFGNKQAKKDVPPTVTPEVTPETVEPTPTTTVDEAPTVEAAPEPVRRVRHRDVLSYRVVEIEGHTWFEVSLSDATTEHVTPEQFSGLDANT